MHTEPVPASVSKTALWIGRALTVLPALVLLASAVMKLMKPPAVMAGFAHLGIPEHLAIGLGVLELACTAIYLIPRTSVLGAILLAGYLGGATAINLRAGDAVIGPVILGIAVWGGIFLREPRLRPLIIRSGSLPARKADVV